MAAAGPAPRGFSLAGARPFQYGAAANNTSSSTQRKQHWRRTALPAAAPRLAARAADARRGGRALPRGFTGSVVCGRRTTRAAMHRGGRAHSLPVRRPRGSRGALPRFRRPSRSGSFRPTGAGGTPALQEPCGCSPPGAPAQPRLCQAESGGAAARPAGGPRDPRAAPRVWRGEREDTQFFDRTLCF